MIFVVFWNIKECFLNHRVGDREPLALGVDLAAVPCRVDLPADSGGNFKLGYSAAATAAPVEGGEEETLEILGLR